MTRTQEEVWLRAWLRYGRLSWSVPQLGQHVDMKEASLRSRVKELERMGVVRRLPQKIRLATGGRGHAMFVVAKPPAPQH